MIAGKELGAPNAITLGSHAKHFLAAVATLPSRHDAARLMDVFNRRTFNVADGGVSYRLINHWTAEGLIRDNRETARGWRKFTLKDLMWLRIVSELRGFGLAIEKLRITRGYLSGPMEGFADALEAAMIVCCHAMAVRTYLLVGADGQAALASQQDVDESDEFSEYPSSYVRINLAILSREILFGARDETLQETENELNAQESEVLKALREGGHNEINISLDSGKVTAIQKTRQLTDGELVMDAAQQIRHGTILLKVEEGKLAYSKITKRTKLKT